jgi:hypothetical protein
MQQQHEDPAFAIRVGLLAVIAFMSWPVWMAIVAGQRSFTWSVAWSAAVPVLLTLLVPFVAFHGADHIHRAFTRLEHALHIDTFVHDHMPHRHA